MQVPKQSIKAVASLFLIMLFVAGILVGGLAIFFITLNDSTSLQDQVSSLQSQVSAISGFQNATYENITINQNTNYLADIYRNVKDSVVLIMGSTSDGTVQGSGFVYSFSGRNVVVTNYHVVQGTTGLSVTFSNGNGYSATVLGQDPYADLAVVSVNAPANEFKPVRIASSSTLRVGEQVIAIGNPYGLVGSLTTGIVSAVGRTIVEDSASSFSIANIIQTTTPINPGNSGGPMLNAVGDVIGVTTAVVSNSQGLAFAIPSNTILREIYALITTGGYHGHSYLGVNGQDMSYDQAQQIGVNVTYGWRIAAVTSGGPSDGKLNQGDIIIAMNQVVIKNNDDLASYLEENTLPGQSLSLTVIRGNAKMDITVVLGSRPEPTT
ncbi:trypsin-like peptidase domain-containing protein [Candidatus Bathyarchaeota archaeon]|nr:trypsin-like peptidase domain-containing protein [Candidatus Bathyarchaeota archaeon]